MWFTSNNLCMDYNKNINVIFSTGNSLSVQVHTWIPVSKEKLHKRNIGWAFLSTRKVKDETTDICNSLMIMCVTVVKETKIRS